jgi:hypothetical protein
MTAIEQAQQEWEANTTPHFKKHSISQFRPAFHIHEFRKYGKAIAWLQWDEGRMEIKKIETLGECKGAATKLIEFLKTLADKYNICIFGNAVVYTPDPPIPKVILFSQQQLEDWYKHLGFKLVKIGETGLTAIWYPDAP